MSEPSVPVKSNSERGLELHADPNNPAGPLLSTRPDVSDRISNATHNRIARKRSKSNAKKAKKAKKKG